MRSLSHNFVRIQTVIMALAITLQVAACSRAPTPPTPVSSASELAEDEEAVAARVNGSKIFVHDVQMEAEAQGFIAPGELLEPTSPLFTMVLNSLIDDVLLAQEAHKRGLNRDPYVQHRIKVLSNRLKGNALLESIVDETTIRQYYEKAVNLKELKLGNEYRIRQIVVPTKQAADELLQSMDSDTDFAVLASNVSIDEATRMEGGDLGFVNPDSVVDSLANAMVNTPVGGVSRPFLTDSVWRIIKVEEKRVEATPSLAELRDDIHDFLIASKLEELLTQVQRNADIIRNFEEVDQSMPDAFDAAEVEPDQDIGDPSETALPSPEADQTTDNSAAETGSSDE